jgi:hypothetical protein
MENQERVDVDPEAEIPNDPPAEIPNVDVSVHDAVQFGDQLEDAPIEKEPAVARPDNMLRRSRRIENQKRGVSFVSMEQYNDHPEEPVTYKGALSSEEAPQWKKAADEEYSSLIENETWTLVPLPPIQTPIRTKWVLTIKPGHNEVGTRYKARLVAKGYSQRKGIDYNETFAPVVKHTSLRLILAIASKEDLDMLQLDIKTAFLYGELEEEPYMEQPEGYVNKD